MDMFDRKRGAGNEHAGSKGILGREEIKMADAMSVFLLSPHVKESKRVVDSGFQTF